MLTLLDEIVAQSAAAHSQHLNRRATSLSKHSRLTADLYLSSDEEDEVIQIPQPSAQQANLVLGF